MNRLKIFSHRSWSHVHLAAGCLLLALQKNLERYEERFGRIDLGPDEETVLH